MVQDNHQNGSFIKISNRYPSTSLSFDIIFIVLFINLRFNTTWLYAECYTYRRLSQCMAISTELRDFDFFGGQKKDSFKDNLTAIEGKLIFWLSFG